MSPLTRRLYALAKRHHLSCPLGRALAMTNRHYNDGWGSNWRRYKEDLAKMRSFRLDTAQRWLEHWRKGGSLKKLGTSARAHNMRRRKEEAQRRERLARFEHAMSPDEDVKSILEPLNKFNDWSPETVRVVK